MSEAWQALRVVGALIVLTVIIPDWWRGSRWADE
jgi:hypothetical protein